MVENTGRAILFNFSLLSIPTCILSSYAIPVSILDKISKTARDSLYGSSSNGNKFHFIGWSTTTLDVAEKGLSIKNLRQSKVALMAKDLFVVLDIDDRHWVDIFRTKSREFNSWDSWECPKIHKSSWLCKSDYKTAEVIGLISGLAPVILILLICGEILGTLKFP